MMPSRRSVMCRTVAPGTLDRMPGPLPVGDPVPPIGPVPVSAPAGGVGVDVHIPFRASRCGYCDFNTYTPADGVVREGYVDAVLAELARAATLVTPARVDTV